MHNAIIMTAYKLKEGVSVADFILAADKFHNVFVCKQKGVISCKLLEGDDGIWADYSVWETMDDFKSAEPESAEVHAAMEEYFSFIDVKSVTDLHFNVRKTYKT